VTYPPPPGTPDPYGQQQPSQDPFAAPPPAYDPTAAPPPAYDPYGQQPVSPPPNPYAQPAPAAPNPYDPYAQQSSPAPQYPSTPQYGQPYGAAPQYPGYGPQMADPNKQNGLAIGAMITGIASILIGCCCWPLGLIAGAAGGVMGFIGRKQIAERGGRGQGMALAGIITGGVGVLVGIAGLVLLLTGANQSIVNDILNNSGSNGF
jgi:hypothetical protein